MRESRRRLRWVVVSFFALAALVGVLAAVRIVGRGGATSEIDATVPPTDVTSRSERAVVRRDVAIRKTLGDAVTVVGTAAIDARYTGRVVADGLGISAASVRAHRLNDAGETVANLPLKVTDQKGVYSIVAPPARYWIVATSPDGRTGSLDVVVGSTGGSLELPDLEVSRGASITGTVRWHGEPRSHVYVSCRPATVPGPESVRADFGYVVGDDRIARAQALTDKEGRYELKGLPPGEYVVEAELPMRSPSPSRMAGRALGVRARVPGREVDFDFKECAVTFEFESSTNELGRVFYEIHSLESGFVTGYSVDRYSRRSSDADGCRVVACLPPGGRYEIAAVAERHLRKNVVFSIPAGAKAMTVNVPLEKCEHFGSLAIRFGGPDEAIPKTATFRLHPLADRATTAPEPSIATLSETRRRHATAFSLAVKEGVAFWSEVDVEAGRYRLETTVAVRPRPDSVFLAVEVDIVPGISTAVTVPIETGGFVDVAVHDGRAMPIVGHCYVKDASGRALSVGFAQEAAPGSRIVYSGIQPLMTPRLELGGEQRLAVPLPAGRYTLRVESQGYETRELPFEIFSGQATKVEAVLRKAPN